MNPGETILGLDFGHHLWVVLSRETADGRVAIANFTTHGQSSTRGLDCAVIRAGEHPYVMRASCVYYRRADLKPLEPLEKAREQGTLRQHAPCSPGLLRRIQDGALASRFTRGLCKRQSAPRWQTFGAWLHRRRTRRSLRTGIGQDV